MINTTAYDENIVLQQISKGNEKAFSQLVQQYWNNIYSQALIYLKSSTAAQDVVQEVFIKVWVNREKLPNIESFDSYLFILARNLIISEFRKQISRRVNVNVSEMPLQAYGSPDEILSFKQSREMVAKAIDLLPPQQKIAFILSRDEGLSYDEIAFRMQLSRETIKKHIGRALNFLRTYMHTHSEMYFLFVFLLQ